MPSLIQIGSVFARYANLTLGGGSATTVVIHGEIVQKRGVSEAHDGRTESERCRRNCSGAGYPDYTS